MTWLTTDESNTCLAVSNPERSPFASNALALIEPPSDWPALKPYDVGLRLVITSGATRCPSLKKISFSQRVQRPIATSRAILHISSAR